MSKRSLLIFACLSFLLVAIPQSALSADSGASTKVEAKVASKVVVATPASQPVAAPAVTATTPVAQPVVQPEGANWWQVLLKHLLELVFVVLGILATGFVTVLMRKYGFEAQTTQVNDVLARAQGYAEQLSVKKLKLDKAPLESVQKMELAIQFAQKLAEEYKIKGRGKEWWEGKLESWIGMKKNGSTSA